MISMGCGKVRSMPSGPTAQRADEFALRFGERRSSGYFGAGVAHAVEEDGFKTANGERDVKQSVVDGRMQFAQGHG